MITLEKHPTQKQTLLQLFRMKKTLSNYELRALNPPMFQYPVRIKELIEEGNDIRGHHDPNDRRKYYYTLYDGPQKDLFQNGGG